MPRNPNEDIPPKEERLAEFFRRLERATSASSFEEGYAQLCTILNEVEDELTGLPNDPQRWRTLGRLFPPQRDRMSTIEGTEVKRFDSRRHVTFVGPNGAIEVRLSNNPGAVVFSKSGSDGRSICEICPRLRDSNR
jgi:hypothetical protein